MRLIAIPLVVAALAGCGRSAPAGSSPENTVRVDGSSTVYLISESAAKEYKKAGFGEVAVAESGTGGGFRKLCRGEIDVSGASRPITLKELESCKQAGIEVIELPIGFDGISVVVHPRNTWVDHLTLAELKAMWEPGSKVTSWKQVRGSFPDRPLRLYGPGADSGTYDYFTLAVNGQEHASRSDYVGSEDDRVLVRGVAGDENGLAVFGYAYYVENVDKLKLVPIDDGVAGNGDGPIAPSQETVANGTYQPLARPVFIYVSSKAVQRRQVEHFVKFYLDHARKLVADAGYIALPAKGDELAKARYKDRRTGTAFPGGSKIGVTMEELYAAEAK